MGCDRYTQQEPPLLTFKCIVSDINKKGRQERKNAYPEFIFSESMDENIDPCYERADFNYDSDTTQKNSKKNHRFITYLNT